MNRELDEMSITELQDLARERGLRGASRMRKPELVRQLRRMEHQRRTAEPAELVDPGAALRQWVQVQPWSRWLSLALRSVGSVGLALSVIVMIATPIATAKAIPGIESGLRAGADSLVSLAETLELAQGALGSAADVLEGTGEALTSVEQSIANTQPLIESVAGLVGGTVPLTIEGTQRTLETAVQGAHAIDQVLRGLAAFSPLTGVTYDPEQTLEASLANAADGLEPLPAVLRDIQRELEDVGSELDTMRGRLSETSTDLLRFAGNLRRVHRDLGNRVEDLRQLAIGLDRAADSADVWLWGVVVIGELILAGAAATQWMVYRAGRQLTGV